MAMSLNKGIRSAPSRKSSLAGNGKPLSEQHSYGVSAEKKTKSLQSLQDRLCFALKRPRTRRPKAGRTRLSIKEGDSYAGGLKKAAHYSQFHRFAGNSTMMESGLIQIPHLQYCEYYERPSPPSISSGFSTESVANSFACVTSTTPTSSCTSASSSITHASAGLSPISPLEYTSSDDRFACDEVLSLVSSCSDMVMPYVLDFMPAATADHHPAAGANGFINSESAATRIDCAASNMEDDGEPYNIDLRDFEPDVNSLSSPSQDGAHHHRNYAGGVLCLRLDYEEVLRAWKERQECLISREPIYYPSAHLDPVHFFGYPPFIPCPNVDSHCNAANQRRCGAL